MNSDYNLFTKRDEQFVQVQGVYERGTGVYFCEGEC